ncbi:ATP-binding protein [Streptomyces sp. NPDC048278]|uniref:ATP-binding protein n=1 Tax=Streptomyces sp. NPDC048278 TaxID=3155809 RepID=UPI003424EA7B
MRWYAGRSKSQVSASLGVDRKTIRPVGVGKTHVAQALGHQAVRQGANVRFAKASRSRLLAELAGGHADRTWDRRMREAVRPTCSSSMTSPCVG